ncbi:hypothetical protein LCGC14_0174720 [marine sediment metagenome]|uniref:Uncharacterized protein n=1 Tax=marine sediment metagenome TaxID=412755 RepID=A0A0F9XTI5_9ZZZZ
MTDDDDNNLEIEILHEALLDFKEKMRLQGVDEDWAIVATQFKHKKTNDLALKYERLRDNTL